MKYIQKISPFHVDERGEMSNLLSENIKIISALFITSKKGSIRANHYHKKDEHYTYILKGKMEYVYTPVNKGNKRKKTLLVSEGEIVYTPPMTAHAVKFLEDSILIAFSTRRRNQKTYEKDTVRIDLI